MRISTIASFRDLYGRGKEGGREGGTETDTCMYAWMDCGKYMRVLNWSFLEVLTAVSISLRRLSAGLAVARIMLAVCWSVSFFMQRCLSTILQNCGEEHT